MLFQRLTEPADAALGPLIPYIQPWFHIGLLEISYIYLVNFAGGFTASFANIHICSHLGTGGTLVLGVAFQCTGYALMFWAPSFPFFLVAFVLTGFGLGIADAQANSFTVTVRNSHRWLGVLHAVYGLGTILAPLIANPIAAHTPRWQLYYLISLILGVINMLFNSWTFRHGLFRPNDPGAKGTPGRELRETLSHRSLWFLTMFFFLYSGAEITLGGRIDLALSTPRDTYSELAANNRCRMDRPVPSRGAAWRTREGWLRCIHLLVWLYVGSNCSGRRDTPVR